jgi:tRNA A58 N-methylase Trm61
VASQLVGPTGTVVGVDMTPEQLQVARDAQSYHAEQFGYNNVQVHEGLLEHLDEIDALKAVSFDLII